MSKSSFYISIILLGLIWCIPAKAQRTTLDVLEEVKEVLRDQILEEAAWALKLEPVTVTSEISERSAGGKHDYFSEGDYWWPDPENPAGPYRQRDGETNPGNFTAHREAMIRFSRIIGALASATILTDEEKYVEHAMLHLKAWFLEPETRMNPSLEFAQAIKGKVTGRGIGIIDTVHLMEVAQGIRKMENSVAADQEVVEAAKKWFSEYLEWMTKHPFGIAEMNWKNNHSTCWTMQVATFARFVGDEKLLDFCRNRYKEFLLPNQMAEDGSFPLELERTKPFGYSIFNLDAMTTLVQILSDEQHNLWDYETSDGKSIKKGIDYLFPYVVDKDKWPFQKDVMYWENWPVAQPFLVFGAKEFNNSKWLNAWRAFEHQPTEFEVIRNLPVRNPVIWM